MASISSLGAGSGLDLESLLTQLLAAETVPLENRLNVQEANIQSSISAFGSFRGALSTFQSAVEKLSTTETFSGRLVSSTDDSVFTATATNDASFGSYDVNVLNLAEANKLATNGEFANPAAVIGTGQITVSVGSDSFSVDITAGSLTEIRDAINSAEDNAGVTATILTVDGPTEGTTISELVFTANETGADNALTIAVVDDDLADTDDAGLSQLNYAPGGVSNQLDELNQALDSRITVDGFTVSSATNTFADAIEGVTITALSPSEDVINDPPGTLGVALNTATINNNVGEFVESYNQLIDNIAGLTSFNVDAGTQSALNGDFTVRTFASQLRQSINSQFFGLNPNYNTLVELGITTTEGGKLELDSAKLNDASQNGLPEIEAIFSGANGVATKLDDLLDGYLGSGGLIQSRETGFNVTLDNISDQRDQLARRLDTVERRFRQQFAALDSLVAQLNSTGTFLTQQLSNISSIINRDSN